MSEKLKILTEKIYHEGIEKAQEESKRIIEEAQKEAQQIRSKAQKEKEQLIQDTKDEMTAYRQKVLSEIRMSARKTANVIKKRLHELLVEEAIQRPVSESLKNPTIMREILMAISGSLTRDQTGNWKIQVADEMLGTIQQAVATSKHQTLNEGVTILGDKELNAGFIISEENGAYKILFDEKTFTAFLNQFLKLETQKILSE